MIIYNNNLQGYSRELRKSMTDAEVRLWSRLRLRQLKGYQFYRQRIIGNYIVDFFCPRAKLVIEVDGGQHYFDKMVLTDIKRDDHLKGIGLKVLRFTDTDVLTNTDAVLDKILEHIDEKQGKIPPLIPLSPKEEIITSWSNDDK